MSTDLTISANRPVRPCLKDSLRRRLNGKHRSLFTESGEFIGSVDEWKPGAVTVQDLADAKTALVEMDRYLAPPPPARIMARAVSLLAHFYVNDFPAPVQKAVAGDWANGLGEFPEWAIQEACRKWLNMERRKPTIADIRDLCQRACKEAREDRDRLRRLIEHNSRPQPSNVVSMPASLSVPKLRSVADAVAVEPVGEDLEAMADRLKSEKVAPYREAYRSMKIAPES